ncbi:MAG: recombination mediator RecR [Clostridiales bacterium]|nr:recombination mediator RecR [Clostridiales bacterium]
MPIPAIETLAAQIGQLPGVGKKTALRYAYHILGMEEGDALGIAAAICDARETVRPCAVCGQYTDRETCDICADPRRARDNICVVSAPADVPVMERTRAYRGLYHVLFGSLSPMDGIGPEDLRVAELLARVQTGEVREVILATNSDAKGDVTAAYLARELEPYGVLVTRIARGIPIGGNLEYTDEITLAQALAGRKEM